MDKLIIIGSFVIAVAFIIKIISHLFHEVIVHENTVCIYKRYGKLIKTLNPGRHIFWGRGHEFRHIDTRLQQITLQTQELTTSEGITVKTTAVGLYKIVDPNAATTTTENYQTTLYTLIQLALRDIISGIDAETLLSKSNSFGNELLDRVQSKAHNLGLELSELVVRDVILPNDIKAALSESWRTKKAVIAELENARGKVATARTLANAAKLYENNPTLLKIRYLEALEQSSKGMGNTFVLGLNEEAAMKNI